jgi:serine/threonine protein kinase/Tol biopolymer transport system component
VTLAAGSTLGPYEILSPLGAGGMGEVYRARDTKLNRDVALKILPADFALDADRLARFKREAQVLASLDHPNIGAIYGLEDSEGVPALVLQLVEGPTLADRIARGPIPIDEALSIARQIAEALDAAHEQGIIHRDLKPANIKRRPDGVVKVLDFGLAKLLDTTATVGEARPYSPGLTQSPTITTPAMTQLGMILGTAAYMSPEQAKGRPADKRSDVWAFGCVLYEMLTGRRAFEGDDVSDTLAAVLRGEPEWSAVPGSLSAPVTKLLEACLAKDPRLRVRDAATAIFVIDRFAGATETKEVLRRSSRTLTLVVGCATAAIVLLAPANFIHWREQPHPSIPVAFEISPPAPNSVLANPLAMAPDGGSVAFVTVEAAGSGHLWIRRLDSPIAVPVVTLSGNGIGGAPFWSPDGRYLAFVSEGRLQRVPVSGGPPETISDAPSLPRGGAWTSKLILLGSTTGLYQVRSPGGALEQIATVDASRGDSQFRSPAFLPDGVHFVYARTSSTSERSGIYVGSVNDPSARWPSSALVTNISSGPVYAESGADAGAPRRRYLLFTRQGALFAQPFDPETLRNIGEPAMIAADVRIAANINGFAASLTGALVYREGSSDRERLVELDRAGKRVGVVGEPGRYLEPSASPDGRQVAVTRAGSGGGDIRVIDRDRNITMDFAASTADERSPVWSPDGKWIAFAAARRGPADLYRKSAAGTGTEELLLHTNEPKTANDWSRDGKYLLFTSVSPNTGADLWALSIATGKAEIVSQTDGAEGQGQFSPGTDLVAFSATESGVTDIYVQPFPTATRRWKVSNGGGVEPRWRRDGTELFYRSLTGRLMSVQVSRTPELRLSVPQPALDTAMDVRVVGAGGMTGNPSWIPDADGTRFIALTSETNEVQRPLTVIMSWPVLMRQKFASPD